MSASLMHGDYYRNHAARVRELASETITQSIKDHLHDVARQYDLLAEKADEAGRQRARSGSP